MHGEHEERCRAEAHEHIAPTLGKIINASAPIALQDWADEHFAAKLGREPMGFAQGLAAMKKEQDFRRDFADLA